MATEAASFVDQSAKNMEPFLQSFLSAMVDLTRESSDLPLGAEYQYMLTFPSFRANMNDMGQKVLHLTQKLIDSHTADAGPDKPDLLSVSDANDAEDVYGEVSDVVDSLVERVVRVFSFRKPLDEKTVFHAPLLPVAASLRR